MKFVDTHTHLYDEAFDSDSLSIYERALGAGVTKWVLPAIDSTSFKRQHDCAAKFPQNAFMAMGLHPTSVAANYREELEFALSAIEKSFKQSDAPRYVAVGEIGLDAYWSRDFMTEQMEVFRAQIEAAIKYDLPIIIHQRNATEEMFSILGDFQNKLYGVFHAFGGGVEIYRRIKKCGDFKVGIGGVVTFKNAGVAKTLCDIPLEDIILETDSPWLTPAPYRGKRNESSYIPIIAQKVAEIKCIDLERVAMVTTANAEKLFRI